MTRIKGERPGPYLSRYDPTIKQRHRQSTVRGLNDEIFASALVNLDSVSWVDPNHRRFPYHSNSWLISVPLPDQAVKLGPSGLLRPISFCNCSRFSLM